MLSHKLYSVLTLFRNSVLNQFSSTPCSPGHDRLQTFLYIPNQLFHVLPCSLCTHRNPSHLVWSDLLAALKKQSVLESEQRFDQLVRASMEKGAMSEAMLSSVFKIAETAARARINAAFFGVSLFSSITVLLHYCSLLFRFVINIDISACLP
jgi:hypothetical protein